VLSARLWTPRAEQESAYSDTVHLFLDSLKKELAVNPGVINGTLYKAVSAYALHVTDRLFYDSLEWPPHWQEQMSGDRKNLNKTIARQFSLFSGDTSTFAGPLSLQTSNMLLEKLQQDVAATRLRLLEYCYYQIPTECNLLMGEPLNTFAVANAQQVKAGQTIELIAGVGKCSFVAKPAFTIAGKPYPQQDNGTATYRFKAVGIPGRHTIPIRIQYYAADGTRAVVNKDVAYTIAP
jgi:hypothetical protein